MDIQTGDKVTIKIVRQTGLGFTAVVNGAHEGLLYKNELYQKIAEGQELTAYVKKIREDGKLDLSLQPLGFKRTIVTNEIKILKALKANDGFLALHDKSSPEAIKYQLGMSKKSFKNALGGLFRQKIITLSPEGIHLVST